MAQSTGPIVTLGAITWANGVILQPDPQRSTLTFSTRVAVGTAIAGMSLAVIERASPELAKGIAWVALVTVLFTRIGGRASPTENLLRWWRAS